MAKLHELEKYLNHEFSTGCYTGDDYKTFQRKYINYLRALCKEHGWELCNPSKGHYIFSAFIRSPEGNYIYVSIPDVRFWKNQWYNHILIRCARNEKDYRGYGNNYTHLTELAQTAQRLFERF